MLREKVWKYDPDMVLLAVTTGNDISDDSRALKKTDDLPYFVLADGKLVLDDSFRNSSVVSRHQSKLSHAWESIVNHLLVLQAVRDGILAVSAKYHSWRNRSNKTSSDGGLSNQIYHEPRVSEWGDAWRVTEALIVQMSREVRSKGRQFFVVTLSNSVQVNPDPKFRAAFIKGNGISDLFYPDRRIQSLCDREGIPCLILAPILQEYAEHNQVFLHGFEENIGRGHWNERGHSVAGELITHWLCPRLSM
jgi:hypothetical protein